MEYVDFLNGIPIYIATKEIQVRKHHKRRINKKWRKRYGVIEYNLIPYGEVVFDKINRVLYMTKKTYIELKKQMYDDCRTNFKQKVRIRK